MYLFGGLFDLSNGYKTTASIWTWSKYLPTESKPFHERETVLEKLGKLDDLYLNIRLILAR